MAVYGLTKTENASVETEIVSGGEVSSKSMEAYSPQLETEGNSPSPNDQPAISSSEAVQLSEKPWKDPSYPESCYRPEDSDEYLEDLDREVDEWRERRGYLIDEWAYDYNEENGDYFQYHGSYGGYDEESLIELGKAGDLRALFVLYQNNQFSDEIREWARWTAVMYGATNLDAPRDHFLQAFFNATEAYEQLDEAGNPNSELLEKAKKELMRSLAWRELLALRGDPSKFFVAREFMFKQFNDNGLPFFLTDDDLELITRKAREMYDELNEKRLERGLAPFDDSVPPPLATFVERSIAREKLKRPSFKWGLAYLHESECVDFWAAYLRSKEALK